MSILAFGQKFCVAAAGVIFMACLFLRPAAPVPGGMALAQPLLNAGGEGWVEMPAGARSAYIGINGGTVPVSLLTAGDGRSMITFVGRTGNDFLGILHKTDIRVPPLLSEGGPDMPASNATVLMAETAIGNVPVLYCTGKTFARMGLDEEWLPFGLSEKPLLLEGQVGKGNVQMTSQGKVKKYRRVLWRQRSQRPLLSTR